MVRARAGRDPRRAARRCARSTTSSPTTGLASSGSASPTARSPRSAGWTSGRRGRAAARGRSSPSTAASTRAPARSRRARTTSTRPGARPTRRRPSPGRLGRHPRLAARTGSARGSSSTTAASTRRGASARSGCEAVMVNCNPETVSTDYDTSDRLYFEPLGEEEVLAVCEREQPEGVVIQFGGPDPAQAGARARGGRLPDPRDAVRRGRPGRGPRALRRAARRARDPLPGVGDGGGRRRGGRGRGADRLPGARAAVVRARRARDAGLLRRGRPCARRCAAPAGGCSSTGSSSRRSRSTSTRSATATETWVAAVMEHVEEAGVHSGDSSCVLPPQSLGPDAHALVCAIVRAARARARRDRARQRPARGHRGRRGLRARGEPARVADGAVRAQGDRRQPRRGRLPADGGRAPRGARPAARPDARRGVA